ncbi:MAG TPA: HAD-IIB family hydrolase [Polyangiaceae bacterium]|nr:HAD-IIB family hydrolase [Polyangiaceae bacterium]
MQPLTRIPRAALARLRGLAFDLDDTLLDEGRLLPEALEALYALSEAGYELYAVTGRPQSFGGVLMRQWPLDAAVTENGAIAFRRAGRRVLRVDRLSAPERAERRAALERLVRRVRERHPELVPADDVEGRLSDYTFDIGEHERAPAELVQAARSSALALGAAVTSSSVHLHVSLDRADKASGFVRLVRELHELDPARARLEYAFIGDSENDAACFAAFHVTIGVSNLSGRPTLPPRFVTRGARAAGFVEAAQFLISARRSEAASP